MDGFAGHRLLAAAKGSSKVAAGLAVRATSARVEALAQLARDLISRVSGPLLGHADAAFGVDVGRGHGALAETWRRGRAGFFFLRLEQVPAQAVAEVEGVVVFE